VLFIISEMIGGACGGAWVGIGRCFKHSIQEERVLDKVFRHVPAAVSMDKPGCRAAGQESAGKTSP
jgi:hypothetical protein